MFVYVHFKNDHHLDVILQNYKISTFLSFNEFHIKNDMIDFISLKRESYENKFRKTIVIMI